MVEALSKLQGKDIRLTINLDDSNVTTPIEYRRNIYQALREKAQNELQKIVNYKFCSMSSMQN